jgi:hypothetical protein
MSPFISDKFFSLSHYLQRDPPGSRVVELDGKDSLPFSKLQLPIDYIQKRTGCQEHRFAMGMSVHRLIGIHIHRPNLKIVMQILRCSRRHFFQYFFEVSDEKRFALLHDDRHRRMQALDIYDSSFDSGLFELCFYFVGDINEIKGRGSLELDKIINNFHAILFY